MKHKSRKLLPLLLALVVTVCLMPKAMAATAADQRTLTLSLNPIANTYNTTGDYYSNYSFNAYTYNDFSVTPAVSSTLTPSSPVTASYTYDYLWTLYYGNTSYPAMTNADFTSATDNRVTKAPNTSSPYTYNSTCRLYLSDLNNRHYYNNYYYDYFTLTCTVTASPSNVTTPGWATGGYPHTGTTSEKLTRTASWTINRNYNIITASATIYDTNVGYAFDDTPDEGTYSIYEQILDDIPNYRSNRYSDYSVTFHSRTSTYGSLDVTTASSYSSTYSYDLDELADVVFTPNLGSSTRGTAEFTFTVYDKYSGSYYYGTVTFNVKQGESANVAADPIALSGLVGEDLPLSAADFEDWWNDIYSNGTLTYVRFTSAVGGTLYTDYDGSSGTNVVSKSVACYADPSGRQTGLNHVTFVPSKSSTASGTLRFTATGTRTASTSTVINVSGTVNISLIETQASAIEYNTGSDGTVTLTANDFSDAYKQTVGSTTSATLSIKFQNVPSNGSLSYGSTKLTESNIKSRTFTANNIGSITYTAGAAGTTDTVGYICYSGSTAKFIGTIKFTAKPKTVTGLSATLSCTSADGIAISPSTIFNLDMSILGSDFVIFGVPTAGSLYVNETAIGGSERLAFSTGTGYALFSNVTYRPVSGATTGTVTIPFSAYDSSGNQLAGGNLTIELNIPAAPPEPEPDPTPAPSPTPDPAPDPAPSSPSAPGTSPSLSGTSTAVPGGIKQAPAVTNPTVTFGDVANDSRGYWYYNEVLSLANAGIIGGTGSGFEPDSDVTYSEALKMIMLAVGYKGIEQDTGAYWALPYLIRARLDNILPSSIEPDLLGTINRYAIAELAAKAMKLEKVTNASNSPFPDTSDGYVLALYNAGIIGGTNIGFEGNKNFTRAEMACVVWRIYDWRESLT